MSTYVLNEPHPTLLAISKESKWKLVDRKDIGQVRPRNLIIPAISPAFSDSIGKVCRKLGVNLVQLFFDKSKIVIDKEEFDYAPTYLLNRCTDRTKTCMIYLRHDNLYEFQQWAATKPKMQTCILSDGVHMSSSFLGVGNWLDAYTLFSFGRMVADSNAQILIDAEEAGYGIINMHNTEYEKAKDYSHVIKYIKARTC